MRLWGLTRAKGISYLAAPLHGVDSIISWSRSFLSFNKSVSSTFVYVSFFRGGGGGVVCHSCKGYFLLRNIKIHNPPTCSIKDVASRWLFDFLIHRMNVFFHCICDLTTGYIVLKI